MKYPVYLLWNVINKIKETNSYIDFIDDKYYKDFLDDVNKDLITILTIISSEGNINV